MEYRRIKSTGYCPEQDCEYTVEVEFRVFTQVGHSEPDIDKIKLRCPHQNQCPRPTEACPIYQSTSYPTR